MTEVNSLLRLTFFSRLDVGAESLIMTGKKAEFHWSMRVYIYFFFLGCETQQISVTRPTHLFSQVVVTLISRPVNYLLTSGLNLSYMLSSTCFTTKISLHQFKGNRDGYFF